MRDKKKLYQRTERRREREDEDMGTKERSIICSILLSFLTSRGKKNDYEKRMVLSLELDIFLALRVRQEG